MTTALLLPLSGDNNGTIFTDYSPTPKTVTASGNAKTVTDESKYYGSSAYFDGSGDYLSATPTIELGADLFTIECWVKTTDTSQYATLVCKFDGTWAGGRWALRMSDVSGSGKVAFWANDMAAGTPVVASSASIADGEWHHVAVVRSASNAWALYVDGVSVSTSASTGTIAAAGIPITIAARSIGDRDIQGHIQDVRISVGEALYTANFTPPTQLYVSASVSGIITDGTGAPCQRDIVILDRVTKQIAMVTTSDPTTGAYSASFSSTNEVAVIAMDDAAGTVYNDKIIRVTPS
jgi:hypothetical protein